MTGFARGRARAFLVVLAVWALVVLGRLFQLQLAEGSRYRARAQRQQERRIEVSARRGSIYDRAGRELAVSVEASSVYAIPDEVSDSRRAARILSPILRVPERALAARLEQPKGFVWLARKLEPAAADRVKAARVAGIHMITESKRFYPKGALAASVLGYVGTDDDGLAGLEFYYDRAMRGRPGEIVALTDARRSTYASEAGGGKAPEEGESLAVSLDSGIQFIAERELARTVEAENAKSGSVVLLDPTNGEILAMASYPFFDPNHYGSAPADVRRNHAIADAYEPGSTFKIVTGSIALEHHLVRLDEIIETGHGAITIGRTTIREDRGHDYGALTLAGVFEHSSNVGIIRVGLRVGPERLFEGASALGIGKPTGVDLPGEGAGIFRPLSRWSSLSNASISMGQEVAVTALQLARVGATVANGGLLVTPHLVTRRIHPDGRIEPVAPPPPARVVSTETANALRDILVGVVERGTGAKAAIPGFLVAGKTGTAQKAGVGGYQRGRHVPNFVGFAPADAPRLVGVVVLEEPRGKYYAAEVACPLFSQVMSQALGVLRVAPREERVPSTVLASGRELPLPPGVVPASVRLPESRPAVEPEVIGPARTPDAAGLSARQALALFARLGTTVRLHGAGFVTGQQPAPGSILRPGQTHTLFLSETAPPISRPGRAREETSSVAPFP
jgi:cell division protein FtsI/penicillin-binding protein 2